MQNELLVQSMKYQNFFIFFFLIFLIQFDFVAGYNDLLSSDDFAHFTDIAEDCFPMQICACSDYENRDIYLEVNIHEATNKDMFSHRYDARYLELKSDLDNAISMVLKHDDSLAMFMKINERIDDLCCCGMIQWSWFNNVRYIVDGDRGEFVRTRNKALFLLAKLKDRKHEDFKDKMVFEKIKSG